MMRTWRRNPTELTETRSGSDRGTAPCWTCLRRRSPTPRRAPPPTWAGPATATSGSPRRSWGTWATSRQRETGRRQGRPATCSRWWTRSSPWSRWRWRRRNRRRRILQAKNVSLLMSKLWMLPSVAIGLEMKIWFKPHPWPLCERRKFLGLPMFIKSHKHKIMSRAAQSCGQF